MAEKKTKKKRKLAGVDFDRQALFSEKEGDDQEIELKSDSQVGLIARLVEIIDKKDPENEALASRADDNRIRAARELARIKGFHGQSLDTDKLTDRELNLMMRDIMVPTMRPFLRAMFGVELKDLH